MFDAWPYREIWAVDFEFVAKDGERPEPVCLVAWELRSGRKIRLWRDEFDKAPPYEIGLDVLFVAYYASADIGCHLALGWQKPARILDPFIEFRNHTNGLPTPAGKGLLGALAYYGLDGIDVIEKSAMRDLILLDGDRSAQEQAAILDYCESDVAALARLLLAGYARPYRPAARALSRPLHGRARSGAVILAEAIYWFAFFEQRYRLSLLQFIGIVSGETEPRNNEAALLEFIRERGLIGGDDPIERARSLREFQASVPLLVMQAHVLETRIAIIGTLIWGFGDLPGWLYCG